MIVFLDYGYQKHTALDTIYKKSSLEIISKLLFYL